MSFFMDNGFRFNEASLDFAKERILKNLGEVIGDKSKWELVDVNKHFNNFTLVGPSGHGKEDELVVFTDFRDAEWQIDFVTPEPEGVAYEMDGLTFTVPAECQQ